MEGLLTSGNPIIREFTSWYSHRNIHTQFGKDDILKTGQISPQFHVVYNDLL